MREDFVPFMGKPVEAQNMKNPSLGMLRSLFQINQVSKEENQRKNLTSNNFATHLLALWNCRKLTKWPRGVHVAGQRVNKAEGISQALFPLVKPQLKKNNFATEFLPCEFFATFRNSPCVIFKYIPIDSVRFLFQYILCNYPSSPCNQLKIFCF